MTEADVWAWAFRASQTLGSMVMACSVVVLCVVWGAARIREVARP